VAPTVSVLIVDDQAPFRRAAAAVIAATPGFEVVGEAESAEQAVELAASLDPELVVMDIKMPGIGGVEATRRITAAQPETVVMLVSTYQSEDLPDEASACGAAAYVHKEDFSPEVLEDLWHRR
jgi:two-component system, NarL family, invasion response regulator UvrY